MSLFRKTARVAAASSVHGHVQRRQQTRWAASDQAAQDAPSAQVPAPVSAPVEAAGVTTDAVIEQLTKLGELHRAGVLTDEEFVGQKAILLARPRL